MSLTVVLSLSDRRGVQALKPLNKKNTGDEQVKALLLSLQTNLSMMLFKQEKFKQSLQVATYAIQIESFNVKARYRRAVAHRKLGNLEEARDDLRVALKTDEKNVSVRKELAAVKKALETSKESQKKGLAKAFSRGSSLLYDDKEEQERQKEELAKIQKILDEEQLKKRKLEWEDECVKRMTKGETVLSFEEWEKERQENENAEKKKKRKEEKRLKEERRKAQAAAKKEQDSDPDDDDELTEKEIAQLRGYKKTADGRVTSYFTKELSETEKNLIGDIAPKKLDSPSSSSTEPTLTTPSVLGETSAKGRPSAWNQSGTTWEEKDTTEWCRKRLKSRLKQTKAEVSSGPTAAIVTKVENMVGDASVAIVSGKKRYIFDFHCKISFDVRNPDTQDVLATGSLQLPDICSTHHEELEVTFSGWTKSPEGECIQNASDCQVALCSEIRESVKLWVTDFNEMY
jgi:tetratricopeptide (TPR) repeat protein